MVGRHLLYSTGISALALFLILRPFVPGSWDPVAVHISTALQFAAILAVPAALVAFAWLGYELKLRARGAGPTGVRFGLAVTVLILSVPAWGLATLVAFFSMSATLGAVFLVLIAIGMWRIIPALRRMRVQPRPGLHPAPLYLLIISTALVTVPLVIAKPVTAASRARSIQGSAGLIAAIEAHRRANGRYPPSLVALNPDYFAPTVGVQGYQYALRGESFNLSFEQPRFFLDNIGAREIVVYNPLDQHLFMSHAAWILEWSPEALATRQGWHDAHDAGVPHWKFFWFD